MISHIKKALEESKSALELLLSDHTTLSNIEKAGKQLALCFKNNHRVYSCGNGGSMCDAMHFAEELSGKFRKERAPLAALAISDPAHMSCVGNDYGYDEVFSRFVDAHGQKGDILVAISTSGKSPNVLKACEAARKKGLSVIALTGKTKTALSSLADIEICTPSLTPYSDRVQELHIKCIHILIELVERELFSPEY